MNYQSMQRLIAPATYLTRTSGSPCQRLTSILEDRPSFLAELAAASTGKTLKNTLQQPLIKTMQEIRAIAPFLQIVQTAGAEEVCSILHSFRPTNMDTLILLLEKDQQRLLTIHYFAECMRFLVLSKMQPGSSFPSLGEVLERRHSFHKDKAAMANTFVDKMISTFRKKEESA